jgi:hypothetical protein
MILLFIVIAYEGGFSSSAFGVVIFFVLPPSGALVFFFLSEYLPSYRKDVLRSTVDDETRARIERSFENVKEFLNQELMTTAQWKSQIQLHGQLNAADTGTLKTRLEKAGVLNPHNSYYLRGKTLEEALTLAVWQSRHDRDEAIKKATEADRTRATAQTKTAPDLEQRREAELQAQRGESRVEMARPPVATQEEIEETGLERY